MTDKTRYEAHRSLVRESLDLNLGFVDVVAIAAICLVATVAVAGKAVFSLGEENA
jgi:hypothetical protein